MLSAIKRSPVTLIAGLALMGYGGFKFVELAVLPRVAMYTK